MGNLSCGSPDLEPFWLLSVSIDPFYSDQFLEARNWSCKIEIKENPTWLGQTDFVFLTTVFGLISVRIFKEGVS